MKTLLLLLLISAFAFAQDVKQPIPEGAKIQPVKAVLAAYLEDNPDKPGYKRLIYAYRKDGKGTVALQMVDPAANFDWSPDGTKLVTWGPNHKDSVTVYDIYGKTKIERIKVSNGEEMKSVTWGAGGITADTKDDDSYTVDPVEKTAVKK